MLFIPLNKRNKEDKALGNLKIKTYKSPKGEKGSCWDDLIEDQGMEI